MRAFVVILFLHVIPALLALRIILMRDTESRVWRAAWATIAACVPFIGPLLFFGLAELPPIKPRAEQARPGASFRGSMGIGGSGAEGIPFLNALFTEEGHDPDAMTGVQLIIKCRARAEAGDAKGQTALGMLYEHGSHVEQDYTEAMAWYRKAANQGFAPAQNQMGEMYAKGLGVEKNNEEACFWFTLAALSDAKLIPQRDKSAAGLAAERLEVVRRRARNWIPAESAAGGV